MHYLQDPIIIIGMHRSGTTMITKLLGNLGLAIGETKEGNEESVFFLHRNEQILRACGGSWEYPNCIDNILNDENTSAFTASMLSKDLKQFDFGFHSGFRAQLKSYVIPDHKTPWGWKDPRNSFLLPLWLRVFPKAKVIHIYRNGLDVANSLHKRAHAISKGQHKTNLKHKNPITRLLYRLSHIRDEPLRLYLFHRWVYSRRNFAYLNRYNRIGVQSSTDLEHGFSLWESYTQRCLDSIDRIENEKITVKYEDFLENPVENLKNLALFCGLSTSSDKIDTLCKDVNSSRSYAFMKDSNSLEFYEKIRSRKLMNSLGYGNLTNSK